MVEEATASSQAQADLANSLHELVSQYRVSREDGFGRRPHQQSHPVTSAASEPARSPVERRGSNRPWQTDRRRSGAASPAPRSAATGTDDTDWEEF
jgi:hypothetical protein